MKYGVYCTYAEFVPRIRHPDTALPRLRICVSVRRAGKHRGSLLQPGDIRQPRAAARRTVHLDDLHKDISIRRADAFGAVASRSRGRSVLLHHLNTAGHRLAGHVHHNDGELSVSAAVIFPHAASARSSARTFSGKFASASADESPKCFFRFPASCFLFDANPA